MNEKYLLKCFSLCVFNLYLKKKKIITTVFYFIVILDHFIISSL